MNEIEYNKLIDRMFVEIEALHLEKMDEIGNKISDIANELRIPLNIISTATYLLKKSLKEGSPQGVYYAENIDLYLSQIKNSIKRADNIISNIIDFTSHSKKESEILDITSIIEQALAFLNIDNDYRNIKVIKNYSDIPAIEGNLNIIRQIFLNLIRSAVQSMPDGGELTIETSLLNTGTPELEGEGISVKISADGINENSRGNIINPHSSTKDCGIGLDIYIAKKGIELHDGKLDIISGEGKGTSFIIKLPIRHRIKN